MSIFMSLLNQSAFICTLAPLTVGWAGWRVNQDYSWVRGPFLLGDSLEALSSLI